MARNVPETDRSPIPPPVRPPVVWTTLAALLIRKVYVVVAASELALESKKKQILISRLPNTFHFDKQVSIAYLLLKYEKLLPPNHFCSCLELVGMYWGGDLSKVLWERNTSS